MDDIRLSIHKSSSLSAPHVLCVTESWLNSAVSDNFVSISNYSVFRADRLCGRGGGVAVWVIDFVQCSRITIDQSKPPFIDCVLLYFPYCNLLLFTLYIPPKFSITGNNIITDFISTTFDHFLASHPACSICICGDFNQFDIQPLCSVLNVHNIVNAPTRLGSNSTLDYVLLSPNLVDCYSLSVEAPFANSDHKTLICIPSHVIEKKYFHKKLVYDCRRSNISNLVDCISSIDWQMLIYSDIDVNAKCNIFHDTVYDCFTSCIPSYVVYASNTEPPWFNPVLKVLINRRWEAFRSGDLNLYVTLRDKVKSSILRAKTSWAKRSSSCSRFLWQTANTLSGAYSSNPIDHLFFNYTDSVSAADAINFSLCNVFHKEDIDFPTVINSTSNDWHFNVDPQCVLNAFNKYSATKAYGSDWIPTYVYKIIAPFICAPLAHLFNLSVSTCTFPDVWKISHVVCLPKCSHPTINDIRPISLLALPSKIFEKLVFDSLKDTFICNFGTSQFGFRPNSSTTLALIALNDFVTRTLDQPNIAGVQVVSYDFTKAFDKAAHSVVISSLADCKFPSSFIAWVNSYLCNRYQCVRIGSVVSKPGKVTSGVPQGSVLGPALFSIIVSSFVTANNAAYTIKYADDITILFPLRRDDDNNYIGDEHAHFINWAMSKKLTVNPKKCKCLVIKGSRYVTPYPLAGIPFVRELKLLGVVYNSAFNFNSHVSYVTSICSSKLFALRVISRHLPKVNCIDIYNSLIRTILEYCSPLFVGINVNNSKKLEKIQSRAHRIICGPLCNRNCLVPLASRRILAAVKLFNIASNCSSNLLHCLIPPRSAHNTCRFIQPVFISARRRNSFVPFVCAHMNCYL